MLRRFRVLAVVAGVLVIALAGIASAGVVTHTSSRVPDTVRAPSTAPSVTAGATTVGEPREPGCGFTKAIPFDRFKGLPNFTKAKAAESYLAVLDTTQGSIVFRAETGRAPCTTYSFRFLSENHYFDGTHCHRLTTKEIYVLQCGDPTGTGSGGPGGPGNDQNLAGATYPAGTIAMANAGPNTNGSQFFFVWKNTKLLPDYTPFGYIVSGMDVLRKIAAAGDDMQNGPGDGYPHLYVGIRDVRIVLTPGDRA
jgi:peptidyl-prolyl cis-trans isomerase B (cyclophilin B)